MKIVYLLLGSNLGDSFENLRQTRHLIATYIGWTKATSPIYETKAWGYTKQANFLNQVIEVQTTCSPEEVLQAIQTIEQLMGRKHNKKWAARVIDVDILLYEKQLVQQADLVIPHPYLHLRRFTLIPLCDLIPEAIHPKLKLPFKELLKNCPDQLEVRPYKLSKSMSLKNQEALNS